MVPAINLSYVAVPGRNQTLRIAIALSRSKRCNTVLPLRAGFIRAV